MLNIKSGLKVATGEVIILADDDVELSIESIREIADKIEPNTIMRPMVALNPATLMNYIDQSSIFVVNTTCRDRQFWGILGFHSSMKLHALEAPEDTLFDELSLFRALSPSFVQSEYRTYVVIPCRLDRTVEKFLEQRVRYAYENLAYPLRTVAFATIIPILWASAYGFSFGVAAMFAGVGVAVSIAIALLGWLEYGEPAGLPMTPCFVAPIWVLCQAIFVWPAIFMVSFRRGVLFSGAKLYRAA
jgi:hypothetical protein